MSRLDYTRLASLKRSLESIGLLGRIPLRRVDAAVGRFHPEVVVSVMERHDYVDAARRFCGAHGLPLVLIVHDRLESFELVYPGFRRAQLAANARVYRSAVARLCVSPQMVTSLDRVYGAQGTVLYPNRSADLRPRAVDRSRSLVSPPGLTLGYCGSLAYGYGDRIKDVMPVLARHGAQLRIYSHDRLGVSIDGIVECGGFGPDDLWPRVQQECDVVWLPYAYDARSRRLYETHFPSKLTEYVALGMPVLITGPSYATGVDWGARHAGAVVTLVDETPDDIAAVVRRLREVAALRVSLAEAVRLGGREFDPFVLRRQFVDVICAAAGHDARDAHLVRGPSA
jgi:glycosyltransferase involved in cell wall biosynthesis